MENTTKKKDKKKLPLYKRYEYAEKLPLCGDWVEVEGGGAEMYQTRNCRKKEKP